MSNNVGSQSFKGKKILLCITGSIAAYKSVLLLRLLSVKGAEVKVIMTKAATNFVAPLTFSTLSKNKVFIELFEDDTWVNHVMLGRWADVILIAPASCNTIAKMANGICDNLLLAVWLSATCPVILAPAMDEDMWNHNINQQNIKSLKQIGNKFLNVNTGELASGLTGEGRMAEPDEIIKFLEFSFSDNNILNGLNVIITAGPTYEKIDPVRYIGNFSTGTMGISIAEELVNKGANVQLILGPSAIPITSNLKVVNVLSADEMYEATMPHLGESDIIIMAAAVADYAPEKIEKEKIKKVNSELTINLKKTKDILYSAGTLKKAHQTLVGFALETNNGKEYAKKKLLEKNADIIVLNSLKDEGAGFGAGTNKITIFDRKGNEYSFEKKSKREVAKDIVNIIIDYRNV